MIWWRSIACLIALAAAAATAHAQYPLRPTARVQFEVTGKIYKGAAVDTAAMALMIEEQLFPMTFLRAPGASETALYSLKVTLDGTPFDISTVRPVYLRFEIDGPNLRDPEHGLAFHWLFRGRDSVDALMNKKSIEGELKLRVNDLADNAGVLVEGLLCQIPIVAEPTGAGERRDCHLFGDAGKPGAKVRLPFREDDVGLRYASEYLLDVEDAGQPMFHLVRSERAGSFDPGGQLPAYLADGIVARDLAPSTPSAAAGAVAEAGAGAQPPPPAIFKRQIPDGDVEPLPVPEPSLTAPRALLTRGIYVARARPKPLQEAPSPPTQVASLAGR